MIFACGGSDDSDDNSQSVKPVSRNWVFTINGQSAHPGDTIQIPHTGSDITIKWQDPDNPIKFGEPTNTSLEVASGNVFYTDEHWNWWWFASGPGIVKFVLHDYGTQSPQRYAVYVDITPMNLKGRMDIKSGLGLYYHPFLQLWLDNELSKIFITEKTVIKDGRAWSVARPYFKITAFGSDRETYSPNNDSGWIKLYNQDLSYIGTFFEGKVTSYNSVDYWFFQFDYGDYSYEIRKYKGSNNCLWNGEWENK